MFLARPVFTVPKKARHAVLDATVDIALGDGGQRTSALDQARKCGGYGLQKVLSI